MTKTEIEGWFINRIGYLKKSPLEAAKAIWKHSPKHTLPKNNKELELELKKIKEVQGNLRKAKNIEENTTKTNLEDIYHKIIEKKNKPVKRLFFDIETSPNIVLSWGIGRKVSISEEAIISEKAVICICYKWENEDKVYSLQWDKGCDKELLKKFIKVAETADFLVAHNGDSFDIKTLKGRCLYHKIPTPPKFNTIDTLKIAKAAFRLNSNKLNYISKYLSLGEKIDTGGLQLWKDILLYNCKESLSKMVEYCKHDVVLLQKVYEEIHKYHPVKKIRY